MHRRGINLLGFRISWALKFKAALTEVTCPVAVSLGRQDGKCHSHPGSLQCRHAPNTSQTGPTSCSETWGRLKATGASMNSTQTALCWQPGPSVGPAWGHTSDRGAASEGAPLPQISLVLLAVRFGVQIATTQTLVSGLAGRSLSD